MCTAINQTGPYHLFGRTLDIDRPYGEQVVVMPQNYPYPYGHPLPHGRDFLVMGVAHVHQSIPLFYDAVSEAGLCMAGLRFTPHACYHPPRKGAFNVASFELIPWLLSQCKDMDTALHLLQNANITKASIHKDLPATPLHWMLSDAQRSAVIESTATGLHIYENPHHVLTNAPTYPEQLSHLPPVLTDEALPNGLSSTARFVRGVFANRHTYREDTLWGEVQRFFRVCDTVSIPKGCKTSPHGLPHHTVYTACGHPEDMTYYVTTYTHRAIKVYTAPKSPPSENLICFEMPQGGCNS